MAGNDSKTHATTYPRGFSRDTDWKWPVVPARELVTLNYGRALKADTRSPGGIPVFGTNGRCGWHDEPLAKAPGLILGRKGQGPLGVEWCDQDFWVIDTAYYASTLTPDVDLKYLYHLVKHVGLNHLKDGTSNPTLSRDTFGAQMLPLPPLAEQKRIAGILGALDDKIELNRRMNATLEAMARAVYKSWFIDFDPVRRNADRDRNQPSPPSPLPKVEGRAKGRRKGEGSGEELDRLFPDSFQDSALGPIPMGWEVKTADEVSTVGIGKTPPRMQQHWFSENPTDVPWMSIRDLGNAGVFISHTSEFLTAEAVEKFRVKRIPDNTVVLSFKLTMGRVAITDGEMLSNEAIAHFRLNPDTTFGYAYLYCYLKGFGYDQLGSTSSIATAINSDMVRGIRVLVPPKGIAEAFERTIKPLFAQMKSIQKESRTLATLRDTLLPKLLSGELSAAEIN